MGAWGAGAFENDYAMDWVCGLVDAEDMSILTAAFEAVKQSEDDMIEDIAGAEAIAAAEVVAHLLGKPGSETPEEVSAYVSRHKKAKLPAALAAEAKTALKKAVGENSELADLWRESESSAEFDDAMKDLARRLG